VRQGDDGDYVADADIKHHAEFVQDAGQRGAKGDELEDLALADELAAAVVGGLAMEAEFGRRTLGVRLVWHVGHLAAIKSRAIPRVDERFWRARLFLPCEFSSLLRRRLGRFRC
jgi:hypothetical protein